MHFIFLLFCAWNTEETDAYNELISCSIIFTFDSIRSFGFFLLLFLLPDHLFDWMRSSDKKKLTVSWIVAHCFLFYFFFPANFWLPKKIKCLKITKSFSFFRFQIRFEYLHRKKQTNRIKIFRVHKNKNWNKKLKQSSNRINQSSDQPIASREITNKLKIESNGKHILFLIAQWYFVIVCNYFFSIAFILLFFFSKYSLHNSHRTFTHTFKHIKIKTRAQNFSNGKAINSRQNSRKKSWTNSDLQWNGRKANRQRFWFRWRFTNGKSSHYIPQQTHKRIQTRVHQTNHQAKQRNKKSEEKISCMKKTKNG